MRRNRDPLAPIIEGVDLSGIVNRYSFQCEPFQEEGENGGTMLDGSTVRDVLAHKVRLSWTLNALSAQQYAALCAALRSGDTPGTVSATVFDPTINAIYTAPFHVTSSPVFSFAFDCNGQYMAFADGALVLEEKGDEKTNISYVVADGAWWTLYNTGLLDVYCDGTIPDYRNPDLSDLTIDDYPPWHSYQPQITSVTVQNSVTRIGYYAFARHANVTSVAIPNSVTLVGIGAFAECASLTGVVIPANVVEVGQAAFRQCTSLANAAFPAGFGTIRREMFSGCASLTSVTIPHSCIVVERDAFDGCTSLADVYYSGTQAQWDAISVDMGNDPLENVTVHYNSTGPTA